MCFDVLGTGEHNITVAVEAYELNGNKVDMQIDYLSAIYEKIVDISEVELVEIEDAYLNNYYAVFDGEINAKDVLSKVVSESAVVKNADDARLALRNSAKLEELSLMKCFAADVDGEAGVTSADARLILRKAAGL